MSGHILSILEPLHGWCIPVFSARCAIWRFEDGGWWLCRGLDCCFRCDAPFSTSMVLTNTCIVSVLSVVWTKFPWQDDPSKIMKYRREFVIKRWMVVGVLQPSCLDATWTPNLHVSATCPGFMSMKIDHVQNNSVATQLRRTLQHECHVYTHHRVNNSRPHFLDCIFALFHTLPIFVVSDLFLQKPPAHWHEHVTCDGNCMVEFGSPLNTGIKNVRTSRRIWLRMGVWPWKQKSAIRIRRCTSRTQ